MYEWFIEDRTGRSGRLKCRQMPVEQTRVLSAKSKTGEAQVGDKRSEGDGIKERKKEGGTNGGGGNIKRRSRSRRALPCDLLKFIILSPRSHSQDPHFSQHP